MRALADRPRAGLGAIRIVLPLPRPEGAVHAGRWHARLRLSDKYAGRRVLTHGNAQSSSQGVPYCLLVRAFSGLRMRVSVSQDSFEPGATAHLRASLDESGLPVTGATVRAAVEHPDGTVAAAVLSPAEPGAYACSFRAATAGVYRVHLCAEGFSARGRPFTREQLRTVSVWAGGDRPPPPPGRGGGDQDRLCRLLACLLEQKGIWEQLERAGVDVRALRRCVKETCSA